jgi:hypothetical protein
MTRLIKILFLSLITFMFISCKKEPKMHKIKYRIEFIQTPDFGNTDWIELTAGPVYETEYNKGDQFASISPEIASVNREWEYDYWQLVSGDEVTFGLWTAKDYYYRLYVYIDGDLVSSKRVYQDDNGIIDVDENYGIDDDSNGQYITFTYYE